MIRRGTAGREGRRRAAARTGPGRAARGLRRRRRAGGWPAGARRARRRPVRRRGPRGRPRRRARRPAGPPPGAGGDGSARGRCCASCCPTPSRSHDLRAPAALGLLLAAPAFTGRPGVPEAWAVTSDSLAVRAAGAIGAGQAVLLKPVDGVFETWPRFGAAAAAAGRDPGLGSCGHCRSREGPRRRPLPARRDRADRRHRDRARKNNPGSATSAGTRITPN